MKLAKKMLACVIALALVAALAVTSFAAAPVLTAAPTTVTVGEEAEIVISATGIKGLEAFGLEISYDKDALEVVKAHGNGCLAGDEAAEIPGRDLYAAGIPEAGLVTAGGAFAESALMENDDIVKIVVKALKAGTVELKVAVTEWTGTEVPADFVITVNAEEPTTEAPTTEAPTTEAPTTEAPTTEAPTTEAASEEASEEASAEVEIPSVEITTAGKHIKQTGDAGIAAVAGVMAIAAVAFVVTRKKDEQ